MNDTDDMADVRSIVTGLQEQIVELAKQMERLASLNVTLIRRLAALESRGNL